MVGMACPASPHWVNVPDASGGQQHSASSKGAVAIDGQDQAAITCTVRDNGAGAFQVSASMKVPATDPQTMKPVNPTLVTFSTTIPSDGNATGILTIQDNRTVTPYSSADDMGMTGATCNFSVHPNSMADQLAIAPGRMWASVTCPKFRDPMSSNALEVCSIGSGFVILENCLQ
jgi:hypothetical protein